MSSLTGETSSTDINLSGENIGYFTNIITDQFQSQDINYFTGVQDNIQTQINNLNAQITGGSGGGGNFILNCVSSSGYIATNYFIFGAGTPSTIYNPVAADFAYTITRLQFRTNATVSAGNTVEILKNGVRVSSLITIGAGTEYITNVNVIMAIGDALAIRTVSVVGGTGTYVRCNISCATNGVIGPAGITPTFSVGTVSNNPGTVIITQSGTTENPILNFNIPPGQQGATGPAGATGPQGPKGDQGDGPNLNDFYTKTQIDQYFPTKDEVANALAGSITSYDVLVQLQFAGVEAEIAGLEGEIATLQGEMTTVQGEISTLQEQNQNQTAVPDLTTFIGQINCSAVDTDTIALSTEISGTATLNLQTAAAVHRLTSNSGSITINSPLTTIQSTAGFGMMYLGGATDTVLIQNIPFSTLLYSQWIP